MRAILHLAIILLNVIIVIEKGDENMTKIKEIRKQRQVTQKELSSVSGLTQSYISVIENSKKKPSMNSAFKLAKALGTTIEDLFFAEIK